MALSWDCSPAKSCYDLGRARYMMDSQTSASQKPHDDAMDMMNQGSKQPNKVRFAWQQRAGGDRSNAIAEGSNPQDICSYPAASLGAPFAPARYSIAV